MNSNYIAFFRRIRRDFTNTIQAQRIDTFPKSGNEGLYGWTLRPADGKIHRREDLIGTIKGLETDIHENVHTSDERETRYITAEHIDEIVRQLEENNKYKSRLNYKKRIPEDYLR